MIRLCALTVICVFLVAFMRPVAAFALATAGPDEHASAGEHVSTTYTVAEARSGTIGLHQECEPTYDELASDCLLAARGGARVTGDALKAARGEFNKVRPKFWKNEAAINPGKYGADDLARMGQGKPPIGSDGFPMELHHRTPLSRGGSNAFDNLTPMTRTDQRLGSNFGQNHPK